MQAAQDHKWLGFEYPLRWSIHNLSVQLLQQNFFPYV